MVLDQPTVGCPEGHALCHQCYLAELFKRKQCPTCSHPTDESKFVKCRPLEGLIGQLRLRCKHGQDGKVGAEGGAPPVAKRAKLESTESMSIDDLREELTRQGLSTKGEKGELVACLDEHRRIDVGVAGPQRCTWRGRVCELAGHLLESCPFEVVACRNAAAGCKESMLRKDATRHASETCQYRGSKCSYCHNPFEARALVEHEGICQEAPLECPNAVCGVTVTRGSMAEHRGACGREEVACPCPGCEERMVRAEVGEHVEVSGAVHVQKAWGRVAEMEGKVAAQGSCMEEQTTLITELQQKIKEQAAETAGLQKRAEALTHVFTWSTDSSWKRKTSLPHTFGDGVRGSCCSGTGMAPTGEKRPAVMGIALEPGPTCTAHFKCCILDKHDTVFRVVSAPNDCDFKRAPCHTVRACSSFDLTAADTAGAVRADGSIKLRMVVYLYLPE
jgi:uncharacterized coiled-coil protein SlyX